MNRVVRELALIRTLPTNNTKFHIFAAAVSEAEANERGTSLIGSFET